MSAVRWIEVPHSNLKLPFFVGGAYIGPLCLEIASLAASARWLSAGLGILGVTFLWDAVELFRQEKRVKRGHAPANPHNPRHQRILAEYPTATVEDPFQRLERDKNE
jgi:hypothetical protein